MPQKQGENFESIPKKCMKTESLHHNYVYIS